VAFQSSTTDVPPDEEPTPTPDVEEKKTPWGWIILGVIVIGVVLWQLLA